MFSGNYIAFAEFGTQVFEHWGIWLFGALLALLLGLLITPIAGAFDVRVQGAMRLWDWLAVALFSGYAVYDLNRAMRV